MITDPYGGDPLIVDGIEDGDLVFVAGQPRMSSGLENALYLSWFVDANWWGNDVTSSEPGAVGSFHFLPLTRSRPTLTPAALLDIKRALEADAAWMITDGLVKSITLDVSLPAVGWVAIVADVIEPDDTATTVRWKLNWARAREEVA